MKIIGLTGTNGKTTISYLLQTILNEAGYKVAVNGTLTGRLTTPSPWELQEKIAKLRKQKYDYLIMEVSSHGIHQDRVKGIFFVAKLLTNITQDHLDYHKTFRAYKKVKLDWMQRGDGIKIYPKDYLKMKLGFAVPLIGDFNHHNFQAAVALAKALGVTESVIKKSIKNIKPVPGRFEQIPNKKGLTVIVDYAHTPDGLKNVLQTAKRIIAKQRRGKIITVFGCGGDRDSGKRPKMGKISKLFSDISIITSDNPRSEEPNSIINQILIGMNRCCWRSIFKKHETIVVPDRREAIQKAMSLAQRNDLVLLAGKGHENYQVLKNKRIHFDDREEARVALR